MLFFPLYITAWASSLLLNVTKNNNNLQLVVNAHINGLNREQVSVDSKQQTSVL